MPPHDGTPRRHGRSESSGVSYGEQIQNDEKISIRSIELPQDATTEGRKAFYSNCNIQDRVRRDRCFYSNNEMSHTMFHATDSKINTETTDSPARKFNPSEVNEINNSTVSKNPLLKKKALACYHCSTPLMKFDPKNEEEGGSAHEIPRDGEESSENAAHPPDQNVQALERRGEGRENLATSKNCEAFFENGDGRAGNGCEDETCLAVAGSMDTKEIMLHSTTRESFPYQSMEESQVQRLESEATPSIRNVSQLEAVTPMDSNLAQATSDQIDYGCDLHRLFDENNHVKPAAFSDPLYETTLPNEDEAPEQTTGKEDSPGHDEHGISVMVISPKDSEDMSLEPSNETEVGTLDPGTESCDTNIDSLDGSYQADLKKLENTHSAQDVDEAHYSRCLALSPPRLTRKDLRSLIANRGRSPVSTCFSQELVQEKSSFSSSSVSVILIVTPDVRKKSSHISDDAGRCLAVTTGVPTLKSIVIAKFTKVIVNVHKADDDIFQKMEATFEDNVEKTAGCHVKVQGVSESHIRSRLISWQNDLEFMVPCYRRWRYGDKVKLVEFYAVFEDEKGVRVQKMCTSDARERNHDQDTFVHELKFEEYPQFVEVGQPPGIISDIANDPPGQQSVYIPPGDHRKEAYRLSTFENFPKSSPVNVPELAKNGFFYTGFYDRVKCYSCGRTVEKWAVGDRPSDKRWHRQDCLLARGLAHDNIAIGGLFSSANLFHGQSSGGSFSQPMEVGPSHSQNLNGFNTGGVDVSDLTRSGGTYQMQPNSTFVIGPTSVQTRQAPPPSQPPVTTASARNPPVRRGWRMANVISADHKRHLTNLYLNRELDRLASFGRWPVGRPNVAPVALARAGFFYLGDMDRTQCFSCGGVLRNWSVDDDAMAEHRTHFPNCRFVVGVEQRNVPIPDQAETPPELAESYPMRFPMNPHMRNEASRLNTFDQRWPMNRTRAQPQEIAEAGFFFLGERDRVKCWYCNGGLQNWEYEDIPWIEHAKWFPNCQFLLAKQGQLFVYRYLSLSPHLPRPIIGRQDGASVDQATATVQSGSVSTSEQFGSSTTSRDVAPSQARNSAPTPPPTIIDPQEELRKRRERVDKEMREGETVKIVLAMGYDENLVRRTLADKLESGAPHNENNIFEGAAVLLDAVMEKEKEIEREQEEEQATSIKLPEDQGGSISFPTISSNYSTMSAANGMDTSLSGSASGVYQVSGFDEDDDEERDLYSSIADGESNGLVGGATNGPISAGSETRLQHIWKDVPQDPESMKEFIEQKKEERLCKICFAEPANVVFIPCSHMCCCKSCTEAIRHCPVCREKIEKAIITYVK